MNPSSTLSDEPVNDASLSIHALETELETYLESSHEVAEILLTVKDFREVLHTRAIDRGTTHTMSMRRKHQYVSADENGKLDTLKIKKGSGPITFRFTIVDAVTKDVYYPLGIAFEKETPIHSEDMEGDPAAGQKSLPVYRTHVYGRSLYVTDFSMPKIKYKFSVVFQRKRDAEIGIIDPTLEPDNAN